MFEFFGESFLLVQIPFWKTARIRGKLIQKKKTVAKTIHVNHYDVNGKMPKIVSPKLINQCENCNNQNERDGGAAHDKVKRLKNRQ